MRRARLSVWGAAIFLSACGAEPSDRPADSVATPCTDPAVVATVDSLGARLRRISLLAPDTIVVRDLTSLYGDLVTPELLASWVGSPGGAPGRQVSSPWPARIELQALANVAAGECLGQGTVVYATSDDTLGTAGPSDSVRIRLRLDVGGRWRIAEYRQRRANATDSDTQAAIAVLREYYAAISAHDYRRAYALWGDEGRSSGASFGAFAAGFADTERSELVSARPGRIEGAAGSRYLDVVVRIVARSTAGETRRFEGRYTMRRVVVDGATPAQRRWHLDRAELRGAP